MTTYNTSHFHLVVSISGHGFGHVAQTAPILNLLHERMPQVRITVRSAVPAEHLHSRIHAPFEIKGVGLNYFQTQMGRSIYFRR